MKTPKPRTYYSKTITQLGRCKVKVENNNIFKICSFFVVTGNGQADTPEKSCTNTDSISKFENNGKSMVTDNDTINYFLPSPNRNNDKRMSVEITQQWQRRFKDVLSGIECFDGMFSLQVKPDSKPYQAPLRCIAYALQKTFKEEFKVAHRRPTLNEIFLKLNNAQYLSLIDVSSRYHNLKLDDRSSYLITFACEFHRRLPFGVATAVDMLQRRID